MWKSVAQCNEALLEPFVDLTPAAIFAIVKEGVPREVRHRLKGGVEMRKAKALLKKMAERGECVCCDRREVVDVYPCVECDRRTCEECYDNFKCHICEGLTVCPLAGAPTLGQGALGGAAALAVRTQRPIDAEPLGGSALLSMPSSFSLSPDDKASSSTGQTSTADERMALPAMIPVLPAAEEKTATFAAEAKRTALPPASGARTRAETQRIATWFNASEGTPLTHFSDQREAEDILCRLVINDSSPMLQFVLQRGATSEASGPNFLPLRADMKVERWAGHPLGFSLCLDDGQSHNFCAESEELRFFWVNHLREALSALRRQQFRSGNVDIAGGLGLMRGGRLLGNARQRIALDIEQQRAPDPPLAMPDASVVHAPKSAQDVATERMATAALSGAASQPSESNTLQQQGSTAPRPVGDVTVTEPTGHRALVAKDKAEADDVAPTSLNVEARPGSATAAPATGSIDAKTARYTTPCCTWCMHTSQHITACAVHSTLLCMVYP